MKRVFTLLLGALAMVAVALTSAFVAMRLAIHGREAVVPTLIGLTVSDASTTAGKEGLHLNLENRFYSAGIPAGRILAQDPASGSRVRREWPIRITESLGPQRVSIPDLAGESERAATISIRRLSLELGVVAHLAVAGDPDVVLTQTPPANSGGVDSPRLSLLVSVVGDAPLRAYVMPSLVGLSYSAATARAATAGLHLAAAVDSPPLAVSPEIASPAASPNDLPASRAAVHPTGNVIAQAPQAGRHVVRGDVVHVTLSHSPSQPSPVSSQ